MAHAILSILLFVVWTNVVLALAPDTHLVLQGEAYPDGWDRLVLFVSAPVLIVLTVPDGPTAILGVIQELWRVIARGERISD